MFFSKDIFGLYGLHKQVEWSHFEPMLSNFGISQGRKGFEKGPISDNKWLKNGSKPWFSENDLSPIVVSKRMNAAHFELLSSIFKFVPHLSLKSGKGFSFLHQVGPNI